MPRAIVVDDEELVASILHRLLREMLPKRWSVRHETRPEEALRSLSVDMKIRLAIIDLRMPQMSGVELITQVMAARPDLRGRIIVCAGAPPSHEDADKLFGPHGLGCLRLDKPPTFKDLEQMVWAAIEEAG